MMCALSVMLLTLAVVLPTPHDSSGALQEGYSARFHSQPQGGLLREQEWLCTLYSIELTDTHTHTCTHTHIHVHTHKWKSENDYTTARCMCVHALYVLTNV